MAENLQVNPEVNEAVLSATSQFSSLIDGYITDEGLSKYRTIKTEQEQVRFSREGDLYVPQTYVYKFPPCVSEIDQDLSDKVCVPFSHRIAFGPFYLNMSRESKNIGSSTEFMAVPEQGLLRNAKIEGGPFSIVTVLLERYLDEEETDALVEYTKNPAMNAGRLATIMALNEDEASRLEKAKERQEEYAKEQRARVGVAYPRGGRRRRPKGSRYIRHR